MLKIYPTSPIAPPTKSSIILWNILAFQAGSLNIGGFLACQRFVTHVTGFSTLFGADLAQKKYVEAFGYLSVPVFFLIGAMVSALFVDLNLQKNKPAQYHHVFGLLVFIMAVIVGFGVTDYYGAFGSPLEIGRDYSLLVLLSLASGIQNATVTSAYGAVVRTTHLTGLTTDLGIGLVRLFSSAFSVEFNKQELKASLMRVGIIVAYTLGSAFSAYIFLKVAYWGFMIPFVISFILWLYNLGVFKQIKAKLNSYD